MQQNKQQKPQTASKRTWRATLVLHFLRIYLWIWRKFLQAAGSHLSRLSSVLSAKENQQPKSSECSSDTKSTQRHESVQWVSSENEDTLELTMDQTAEALQVVHETLQQGEMPEVYGKLAELTPPQWDAIHEAHQILMQQRKHHELH
jgi:hypothetical protein